MKRPIFKTLFSLVLLSIWTSFSWAQPLTDTLSTNCDLTLLVDAIDPSCPGSQTGSIAFEVSGPSPVNVDFDWLNISTDFPNVVGELGADTYFLEISTDDGACRDTLTVTLSDPEQVEYNLAVTDVTCPDDENGSIEVEYGIDGNPVSFALNNPDATQDNPLFEDLPPGPYTIFIVDENDCVTIQEAEVMAPETPEIDAEITPPTCPDSEDASFIVIVETVSATEDYQYSINGENAFQEDSLFNALTAGSYEVLVRSQAGCIFTDTFEVVAPETPEIDFEYEAESCPGNQDASFIVIVETVSMSENYQFSIDGWNFQEDSTFTNLSNGPYTVYVKDESGCIFTSDFELIPTYTPLLELHVQNESCPGSTDGVLMVINPDTSVTYTYSLDGVGYQSSNLFTNLSAGEYTLYYDDGSCSGSTSFTLESNSSLLLEVDIQDVLCNGHADGLIELTTPSGNNNLMVEWSNGATSRVVSDLLAGDYSVTVTDGFCTNTATYTITEPPKLEANSEVMVVDNLGIITVTASGGTSPYHYAWSNGGQGERQEDLETGNYEVTITDANHCTLIQSFILTSTDAPEQPAIHIFPNPVQHLLTIELELTEVQQPKVVLYSILGQELHTFFGAEQQSQVLELDLSDLPDAVYLVRVYLGEEAVLSRRIVKQK